MTLLFWLVPAHKTGLIGELESGKDVRRRDFSNYDAIIDFGKVIRRPCHSGTETRLTNNIDHREKLINDMSYIMLLIIWDLAFLHSL